MPWSRSARSRWSSGGPWPGHHPVAPRPPWPLSSRGERIGDAKLATTYGPATIMRQSSSSPTRRASGALLLAEIRAQPEARRRAVTLPFAAPENIWRSSLNVQLGRASSGPGRVRVRCPTMGSEVPQAADFDGIDRQMTAAPRRGHRRYGVAVGGGRPVLVRRATVDLGAHGCDRLGLAHCCARRWRGRPRPAPCSVGRRGLAAEAHRGLSTSSPRGVSRGDLTASREFGRTIYQSELLGPGCPTVSTTHVAATIAVTTPRPTPMILNTPSTRFPLPAVTRGGSRPTPAQQVRG
jgi:hypothetical protein